MPARTRRPRRSYRAAVPKFVGALDDGVGSAGAAVKTDTDGGQWGGISSPTTHPPVYATSPVLEGTYSAKFELQADSGDGSWLSGGVGGTSRSELRAEQTTPVDLRIREGEEWYFGWATQISSTFPTETKWWLVNQWKQDGANSPYLSMGNTSGSAHRFRIGRDYPTLQTYWSVSSPAANVWHRFVVRVYFHSDAATGFVEVWYKAGAGDLVKQTLNNSLQRYYGPTHEGSAVPYTRWRQGYYRDPTHTTSGIVYGDCARFGPTFASVAPPSP